MSDLKEGQMFRSGVVKSVDTKTYGTAGKSMMTIRIEAEGFEGKIIPYEVKSFKVPFDAKVGDKVELLVWVNGSYGKGTFEGRIFTDLTLADWSIVGAAKTEDSGTVEHAAEQAADDSPLPF